MHLAQEMTSPCASHEAQSQFAAHAVVHASNYPPAVAQDSTLFLRREIESAFVGQLSTATGEMRYTYVKWVGEEDAGARTFNETISLPKEGPKLNVVVQ